MVYLILTRSGYEQLSTQLGAGASSFWINKDVLSPQELIELRRLGVEITDFKTCLSTKNTNDIPAAVRTIEQHHPGESIWIESIFTTS